MKLGWGSPYSQESKHKWGHMTLHSLKVYREVFSTLADAVGDISGKPMVVSKLVKGILTLLRQSKGEVKYAKSYN